MLWVEPATLYQTHVVSVVLQENLVLEAYYGSDSIPDLCAIATVWPYPAEIVTYTKVNAWTSDEMSMIVDELDT